MTPSDLDLAIETIERLSGAVAAMDDVVAAMQQRNRLSVHSVKGVQASIQNEIVLSERRMRNGVPLDAEALHRQMRHWALVLSLTAEAMQSDG